jgi:hypothetical protein
MLSKNKDLPSRFLLGKRIPLPSYKTNRHFSFVLLHLLSYPKNPAAEIILLSFCILGSVKYQLELKGLGKIAKEPELKATETC